MLLDFESLRCFEAVAARLHFRDASRGLGLSPAALGDRIRRLEEQLGARLFERTTRRVALTEAGARLVPHVKELLAANARSFAIARGRDEMPVDLWVGTRFELGLSWLVPALPGLEAAAPLRTLHLHFAEGPELLARVKQGTLDCAVTSSRIADGLFEYAVLHAERYAFVASARLLERAPFRALEDSRAHTLVDLRPDLPLFRYLLDTVGDGAKLAFPRVESLGTIGAVRLRVLQGRGVAVLPEYFVESDLARGRLRRILPRVRMASDHFRLVWARGHAKSAALQALARELAALPLK